MGERLCGCAPVPTLLCSSEAPGSLCLLSSVVFLRWNIVSLPAGFGPNNCHAWLSSSCQSPWAVPGRHWIKEPALPCGYGLSNLFGMSHFPPILVIANVSHVSFSDYCGEQGPWQTVISSPLCLQPHLGKYPIHTWSIWLHARFLEKQLNETLE